VRRIPSERFAAVPEGLTGSQGTPSTSSMSGRVSDAAFSSTPADQLVLVPPGDPAFHMGDLPVRADRLGRSTPCFSPPGYARLAPLSPPRGVLFRGLPLSDFSQQDVQILRREPGFRSEEHTSELQSRENLVCRLLLAKKNIHTIFHRLTLRS